jgi:hypothetical protein
MRAVLRLAAHELRARWLGWAVLALLAAWRAARCSQRRRARGGRQVHAQVPAGLPGSDVLFSPPGSGLGGYDDALAKLPRVAAIAPLAGLNALPAGPGGAHAGQGCGQQEHEREILAGGDEPRGG